MGLLYNLVLFFSSAYFLAVVGLDSRRKQGADDGFVTVSLQPDRGTDLLFCVFPLLLGEQSFVDVCILIS